MPILSEFKSLLINLFEYVKNEGDHMKARISLIPSIFLFDNLSCLGSKKAQDWTNKQSCPKAAK